VTEFESWCESLFEDCARRRKVIVEKIFFSFEMTWRISSSLASVLKILSNEGYTTSINFSCLADNRLGFILYYTRKKVLSNFSVDL
jgi:hypothetical protein